MQSFIVFEFQVLANISDPQSPLLATFSNIQAKRKWIDCCKAAERCCKKIQQVSTKVVIPFGKFIFCLYYKITFKFYINSRTIKLMEAKN